MSVELDFLRELDKFQLAMKKRVHSQYQGQRETDQFGEGLVFKDFREYALGDDIRFVDWKVYARTDKYFIKRFEEERNMVVHIIVDASASMDYGTIKHNKFDYASMVGLGYAYMALRNNEKFNFSTFAETLDAIRPKKGLNQLMGIVDHLNDMKAEGESKFGDSMKAYKKAITSRSIVVIISDFLYDLEEIRDVLERFKKSEVLAIQVLDPSERKINLQGDFILKDSELKTKLRTFISRRFLKNYQDKLEDHIYKVKEICEETGTDFISVTSDTPVFDVFYQALTGRGE